MEQAQNDFDAIAKAGYADKPHVITSCSGPDLVITTKQNLAQLKIHDQEENIEFLDFLLSIPKGEPFLEEKDAKKHKLWNIKF